MSNHLFSAVSMCSLSLCLASAMPVAGQAEPRDALRDRIDLLVTSHETTIDGSPIAAVILIDALYSMRDYEPAWHDRTLVRQLYDQVLRSVEHGLNPQDFHATQLGSRLKPGPHADDPVYRADTEILCTDALARLAVTLRFGKLDASDLDPAWNFSRHIVRQEPLAYLNSVLDNKTVARELAGLAPDVPLYRRFQNGLTSHRSIMASGGWASVSAGPVLTLGSTGPRVEELRKRLLTSGDLESSGSADKAEFDARLETAVRTFQSRHGIGADGKVGPRTLEELNVPVEVRVGQLRASLERMRWVFRDLPDDFIIVDIAGFRARLFRNRKEVWRTRVQVGKPYHATPVFKDTVRYLEFNPTWTIPPGILRNETLPAIRRDPSYLNRNNMSVVTTSGKVVDPSTIDWSATATGGFPYMIRQEPGPHNALGRVKFMFPNRYMVYLHDTPSKGLFARAERAFSHGCIRTQNPFDLAEMLLADQGWDRSRIDQVLASNKTTRVNLDTPITVMLLYWTAEVGEDGTVYFRRDIYDRDRAVVEGLDEPFRFSPPGGAREALTPNRS
jgi:murein L,D-transpeptidase YcbB/YkuD